MLIDAIANDDLYTIILILVHRKLSSEDLKSSILHFAASHGNATIVQLLLWVNHSSSSHVEHYLALFQYGADPFLLDNNNRTALQCATGDCIQLLQTLTNNQLDNQQQQASIVSPQQNTLPRQRLPTTSPAPPYDKLPSTVI